MRIRFDLNRYYNFLRDFNVPETDLKDLFCQIVTTLNFSVISLHEFIDSLDLECDYLVAVSTDEEILVSRYNTLYHKMSKATTEPVVPIAGSLNLKDLTPNNAAERYFDGSPKKGDRVILITLDGKDQKRDIANRCTESGIDVMAVINMLGDEPELINGMHPQYCLGTRNELARWKEEYVQ